VVDLCFLTDISKDLRIFIRNYLNFVSLSCKGKMISPSDVRPGMEVILNDVNSSYADRLRRAGAKVTVACYEPSSSHVDGLRRAGARVVVGVRGTPSSSYVDGLERSGAAKIIGGIGSKNELSDIVRGTSNVASAEIAGLRQELQKLRKELAPEEEKKSGYSGYYIPPVPIKTRPDNLAEYFVEGFVKVTSWGFLAGVISTALFAIFTHNNPPSNPSFLPQIVEYYIGLGIITMPITAALISPYFGHKWYEKDKILNKS
jgi:hypothetical protein